MRPNKRIRNVFLNDTEKTKIVDLYNSGVKPKEIQDFYNIDEYDLRKIINSHSGNSTRKRKLKPHCDQALFCKRTLSLFSIQLVQP